MTALLVAVGACLLVGVLVDRAWLGAPAAGPLETVGRGLMLGLGTAGAVSMLADGLGLGVSAATVYGGLALLALAALRPALGASAPPTRPPPSRGTARLVVAGLLLVVLAALAFVLWSGWVRPTYQFDAIVRWMLKTKALALDGTLLGPLSRDPHFFFTHQRYPPLLSHVCNLPLLVMGRFDDRVASVMAPCFGVALVLTTYGALARGAHPVRGAVAAAWIATIPLFLFRDGPPGRHVAVGGAAFSVLADIPLATFATGAGLALLDALAGRRDRAHAEVGLLLAFALLTKNEGVPLAAAVLLATLLFAPRARVRRALGIGVLAFGLYALLWGRVAVTLPALDEHYPGQLRADAVLAGLERLPAVLARLARETLVVQSWGLTWPGVVALLAVGGRAVWDRGAGALVTILLVQLTAYVLAYTITAWSSPAAEVTGDPVGFLMDLTLGRLVMQVAPLAVILATRRAPLLHDGSG